MIVNFGERCAVILIDDGLSTLPTRVAIAVVRNVSWGSGSHNRSDGQAIENKCCLSVCVTLTASPNITLPFLVVSQED